MTVRRAYHGMHFATKILVLHVGEFLAVQIIGDTEERRLFEGGH